MTYEKIITVSPRGQVVIPKKARHLMRLTPSSRIRLSVTEAGKASLEPVQGFTRQLAGSGADLLKGEDAAAYVRDLREDRPFRRRA